MCGRYTVTVDPETIYGEFACVPDEAHRDLAGGEYGGEIARPRYNIAPTNQVPVVLERPGPGDPGTTIRRLESMRWGLVPSWAKGLSVGNRMFNTRMESLAGDGAKPAFRAAVRRRRCLLPASGFYEWRKMQAVAAAPAAGISGAEPGAAGADPSATGAARPAARRSKIAKQAYYITPSDGSLLAFAGLWEFWRSPQGEPVRSATVITTAAEGKMADIHDRMPLMLPRQTWAAWLNLDAEFETVTTLLRRSPSDVLDTLEFRPVGDRVGNVRNDDPSLIDRVEPAVSLDARTAPAGQMTLL